ncbi:MAG: glycosyltransferase family 4 protein [Bacteroidota bacterium]|nr:glycosyltransferase family 4 protein [Bacteroidota bacterium]
MSKKVLIITYYWPPAGGPGVQRWLKFVKYLPSFGVEPIIYTPENPTYPIIDNNLLTEELKNVTIIKKPIQEPYKLAHLFSKDKTKSMSRGIITSKKKQTLSEKLLLYVRGNIFIPDARILWVKPSVDFLENYLKENKIDTVITTGPPHSMHLIGLKLKEKFQIKWIADFRDPWTKIVYHKELKLSAMAQKKHLELEKKVLKTATQIIVTSPSTKEDFSKITSKPIEVITNGYDSEEIAPFIIDTKFSIAHIGSLLSERNPRVLWKAIAELVKEYPKFKHDLELKLIGTVSEEIISTLEEFKLSKFVKISGYIPHDQCIVEQHKSQVLLLIESDSEETKTILPGKLYEYMASGRPILAIANEQSDIKRIIRLTNTGIFCDYSEKEKIKDTLIDFYQQYKNNNLESAPIGLQYFSRKNLTKRLADIILKK